MTKDRPSAFVSSPLIRMMSFTFLMLWVSGGYSQAMNEFQKGMAFANAYKMDQPKSSLLFLPYKEKGGYKKAFEHCYIALALKYQMYDTRALAKAAEIERKYNLSKAQQELQHKNT
jgi:hypothetical protein